MEIASEAMGLLLQVIGVLIVLLSQVLFGYRSWRKYRGLRRTFFAMISVTRIRGDPEEPEKSDKELKDTFPEWWGLASYLREDFWTTAIGLLVTLTGLLLEFSHITLTI